MPSQNQDIQKWIGTLPYSKMVFPESLVDRLKYLFWLLYTPVHPYLRDAVVRLGLVNFDQFLDAKGRQKFLVGVTAPGVSVTDLIEHLVQYGYGNHFVAWKDDGEVASLRLPDNFSYQYHIRIYSDGEVRAHYELSPEAYPMKHYYEVGMEERREHFLELLGGKITPTTTE